jgi:uncharacterized membrane protein YbhN (UPF0104 family)
MIKKYKPIISVVLVLAAVSFGVYYLVKHHSLLHHLSATPLWLSASIFCLYAVMLGVLIMIFYASIRLCNLKLPFKENAQLNAHSLFINFFIPGQGGPIYRGVYLLKKYKLKVKYYTVATLLYYVLYAVVSIFMLLVTVRPWWQSVSAAIIFGAAGLFVVNRYSKRKELDRNSLNLRGKALSYLLFATIIQSALQAFIYMLELHNVNSTIHLKQVITYTGAANLALFVGLTPGAIGVRESFLIFTRHLHHISSPNIILANVIDRSVFFIFLIVLLVITGILEFHGKLKFRNIPSIIRQTMGLKPASSSASTED